MSISGNITIVENEINAPITLARDAYQLALVTGFVGTLAEWQESQKGADGVAGANGPAGPNSVTSATSSDGTANLSIQNLTLAEALPIESGGTGGNTTSSARTALGLGGSSIVSFRELRANRLTFGRVVAAGGVSIVPSPPDAGFSRLDANSIALGNGETNDATGSLTLANITATGTITTDGGIAFTGGAAGATRTALGLGSEQSPTFAGVALPATDGSINNSTVKFGSNSGIGADTSNFYVYVNGARVMRAAQGGMRLPFGAVMAWPISGGGSTGISEGAAGQILIGTGTAGSFAGSLKLTNLEATGTGTFASLSVGGDIETFGTVSISGSIFAGAASTIGSLTLGTPLPITSGGTGGNTASTARTALKVPGSDNTGITGASAFGNFIAITQAGYDTLVTNGTTDPATLYVIA